MRLERHNDELHLIVSDAEMRQHFYPNGCNPYDTTEAMLTDQWDLPIKLTDKQRWGEWALYERCRRNGEDMNYD